MINPLVSIIMPCYNRASIIQESINSIIYQTYTNWELIIVDDYSTDNSLTKIEDICKGELRVKVISKKTERKGGCSARNIGFNISKGDFIIFLDSDDILTPDCLQNRIKKFDEFKEFDFLVFQTLIFKTIPGDTDILINTETIDDIQYRYFNLDIPWLTSGPIWKREVLIELGGWDEDLPSWQDWEFHLRAIINKYKFKYIHEVDNYWRFDYSIPSIGKESDALKHLVSQLNLIANLEPKYEKRDYKLKKLLGLKIWILEEILRKNKKIRYLLLYFRTLLNYSKIKGFLTIILFPFISQSPFDFQKPNFGTYKKVVHDAKSRIN